MESLNRLLLACLVLPLPLYLAGCGAVATELAGSPTLTIAVQAQSTTLQAGQSTGVAATVMHAGGNPAVTWALSGSTCPNSCGTLSTVNGETYTSPDFVPVTFTVTVTATAVADTSKSASATLTVNQSLSINCPTGNEAALAGQYAFLLRGGGSAGGEVTAGSITADGKGNITAGLEDINGKSAGPQNGLTIPSGQSLYTVGPDNRGCLGLVDSQNTLHIYRFGLSSLSAKIASAGRIIEFDDTTGNGTRAEGFLALQDAASFKTSSLQGSYVFGLAGGDSTGGRYASAGVLAANAGSFSNGNMDSDDAGVLATNATGVTGSYSVASSGRGTMNLSTGGGQNFVLYMISASQFVVLASDTLDPSHPLQSGQFELQSADVSNNAALNGPAVLGLTSFDSATAAPGAAVGLLTSDGNGNATQVLDVNSGGAYTPLQSSILTYSVSSNGRVSISGPAPPPVFYLSAANQGFVVGTDAVATFGTLEPQTGGPFSNASLSGTYTYGTEGTAVGSRLTAVGSATFDGMQNVQGTEDDSSPAGLLANNPTSNAQYLFSSSSSPPGRGTLDTSNNVNPSVAYMVSPTKLIYFNPPATSPRLVIVEK
jgi:hypothetical protein